VAHADGSYAKLMKQLEKTELLLLDDFGIDILNRGQRNDLLEILEDRHQRASTIITSQLPIAEWHGFIGEAMIADAILDRVIHDSYQINLKGESMRKLRKKSEEIIGEKIEETYKKLDVS
jgi:DNA replication protein DnaC